MSFASLKAFNTILINNDHLYVEYLDYVRRYNQDKYDLKALDNISEFILNDKWIPAYFLYVYNVLKSNYDSKDVKRYLRGEGKTAKYCENVDYIELTNIEDIKQYDHCKTLVVSGDVAANSKHAGGHKQSNYILLNLTHLL